MASGIELLFNREHATSVMSEFITQVLYYHVKRISGQASNAEYGVQLSLSWNALS
jgi:hypothetical protein